jgi:peptidoglycan/xylan/chitin deacetylase (PgdA/CDA1 family)
MPTIRVAMCVDRLSSALPECLGRLGQEVDDPIVAVAGFTSAELVAIRQLVGRLVPDADVIVSAPGIAQTRNAALAHCDAEVIAYLDDDIAVPHGWAKALAATWRSAPDERATVGGPIALRFDAPRPRWLAEGLLVALAPLDYGTVAQVLDPGDRTFHGGNVGFRTAALRGIGGFWPSQSSQRDWFSEEHHAQRELGAAGWTAEYRPELGVERVVRVSELRGREVAGRRLRYGGRAQLVGRRRDLREALKSAASSAAGAGAALVRGDLATASERAGRAAENAGALAAPVVAHRGLQPATDTTPFRPSIPEAQGVIPRLPSLRRGPEQPKAFALLYHRVADVEHDPLGLAVSPADFASHIETLGDRIVALEQLAAGEFADGAVAITFDDGYADNLPALRGIGVPVTVFVSTGHVADGRSFWWDELVRLMDSATATEPLTVRLEDDVRTWPARNPSEREIARRALHGWLQVRIPEDIEVALAQVRLWAAAPTADDPRPLTIDELRELARHVTIGAHGRRHVSLRWMAPEVRRAEMEGSRQDLAGWLGRPPTAFSYPFGVPGRDVDDSVQQLAGQLGYTAAVVNASRTVTRNTAALAIPRFVAPAVSGGVLIEQISGK